MEKQLISLLLCFLVATPVALSQGATGANDAKLDKARPAVYITFECAGTREPRREGESNQGVWLRLHNNLRWQLTVPGFSDPTNFAQAHHGNEVQLYYDVEDTRTRRGRTLLREVPEKSNGRESQSERRIPPPPVGYPKTDLVRTISLASGDSVLFSIPSEHLTRDLAVSLTFQFQWEGSMDETQHRVFFYGSDLPDKAVRQCH